jgi:hypothetical protein
MVKRLERNIKDVLEMGVKSVDWDVGRVEPLDSFPCFSIAARLCRKKRRVMHESIYAVHFSLPYGIKWFYNNSSVSQKQIMSSSSQPQGSLTFLFYISYLKWRLSQLQAA